MMSRLAHKDPDLPPGYYTERARQCVFAIENDNSSPGYRGLAWAILLMAVHDGCCAQWLKEIADGYALQVPRGIFERPPANRIKQKKGDRQLMAVECPKSPNRLILAWADGVAATDHTLVGSGK